MKEITKTLRIFTYVLIIFCLISCERPDDPPAPDEKYPAISLEALGNYQVLLTTNMKFSDIEPSDTYLLGWESDWDNPTQMSPIPSDDCPACVETILTATDNNSTIKSFVVCNSDKTKWLWLDEIDSAPDNSSLGQEWVIPSFWIDPQEKDINKKIIAFEFIDGNLIEPILEPVESIR